MLVVELVARVVVELEYSCLSCPDPESPEFECEDMECSESPRPRAASALTIKVSPIRAKFVVAVSSDVNETGCFDSVGFDRDRIRDGGANKRNGWFSLFSVKLR